MASTTTESTQSVVMVGLPETGKTTYLAAFWYLVERGTSDGALSLVRLPDVRKYLEQIKTDWLTFKKPSRTAGTVDSITENSMRLQVKGQGVEFDLSFPDVLGEIFREQVEHRYWDLAFTELLSTASGLVLFVHPLRVKNNPPIASADAVLEAWMDDGGQDDAEPTQQGAASGATVDWEPGLMPTQVKLVDLVQTICGYFGRSQKVKRLAIVISAWDLVENHGMNPSQWIARHLPLLDQYLTSNEDRLPYRVFGVSAQGGDLAADSAKLQAIDDPIARIRVAGIEAAESPKTDLTFPVRWVLGA